MSGEASIVAKVQTFFFEDDDFASLFETFARRNASKIDLDDDEGAYKLEYTAVYESFQKLFEESLSKFITDQGSTLEEFYEEVRRGFEDDEEGDVALFAKIMMATCDFDIFMQLMRETAEQVQAEASSHK